MPKFPLESNLAASVPCVEKIKFPPVPWLFIVVDVPSSVKVVVAPLDVSFNSKTGVPCSILILFFVISSPVELNLAASLSPSVLKIILEYPDDVLLS